MDFQDFIMEFSGGIDRSGLCRVRIFSNNESNAVIITDLGNFNTGPSVTNSIERIVSRLKDLSHINDSAVIFEHYEPELWFGHKFDFVTFGQKGLPDWKSIEIDEVCKVCQVDEHQLCSLVENDNNLLKEIILKSQIIHNSKLFVEGTTTNNNSITSKLDLTRLIEASTSEREFQSILKRDLSIIAEVYADPKEEYICFSEFPINSRRADFVLFTGRSRMSVFIFEIKGADFFFSNKNGYKKLNEKINTCRHQLIENINQINTRGYEEFRQKCHYIRTKVESGESIFNSLMGNKKYLHVDPNKEINIYGVIIGGKTRDDFYESSLRYHEEKLTSNIKIESWNSFVNKIVRK